MASPERILRRALRRQAATIRGARSAQRRIISRNRRLERAGSRWPGAVIEFHRAYVRESWSRLRRRFARVALLGGGKHARWLLSAVGGVSDAPTIVRILDDAALPGDAIDGVPVERPAPSSLRDIEAIVVATDDPRSPLQARAGDIAESMPVVRLYESVEGGPFPK
jgi:hypothetical protein